MPTSPPSPAPLSSQLKLLDKQIAQLGRLIDRLSQGGHPNIAPLRRGLAEVLLRKGRHLELADDDAAAQNLYAAATRADDTCVTAWLARGHALLKAGQFAEAIEAFEAALELSPNDHGAGRALAALHRRLGRADKGWQILADIYARAPLSEGPHGAPGQARILRMRGYGGSYFTIGKRRNGDYKVKQRGGHFNSRNLLAPGRQSVNTYTIVADNILHDSELPPPDLIINTIADPDLEMAALQMLERYRVAHPDIPIINTPSAVALTTRDANFDRFGQLDCLAIPRTIRLPALGRDADELAAEVQDEGFDFPLILRITGTHTGRSTQLIRAAEELASYFSEHPAAEYYVIAYMENSNTDGMFPKMRFFSIDGRLYPVVFHQDNIWNVHGGNRREVMMTSPALMEQELAFLREPEKVLGDEAYATLHGLQEAVGLDFFGIDFSQLPDGRPLIYEMNPCMRHSFDHADNFPYMRPYMQRISDAFQQMVEARLAPRQGG